MQTASKHLKKDPGLSSEFVNPRVKKENNSFPSKKKYLCRHCSWFKDEQTG